MSVKDRHGLVLTGASQAAAGKYLEALASYHRYAGDPITLLDAAVAECPGFVMAHVLKAHLTLAGANAETAQIGLAAVEAARGLPADARELAHVAAAAAMARGEFRSAGRALEDVSIAHPRDTLALQAGQILDFLVGDSRMLRDRIGRALPAWSADMPDYHAVMGLWAFGLEETGDYARAEAAGRMSVELEPRNGWGQHAVAHVLEMQDRRTEGVAWMRADIDAWTRESFFAVHNWWHLALFHLGLGEVDEVLALYDGPICGGRSDMAFDMVDAAALLWRLTLMGVDVGDRWAPLAEVYVSQPRGLYAFDDAHAMMAFVGAGRQDAASEVLLAQTRAQFGAGDNVRFAGEIGQSVVAAIQAFGEGDYWRCADLLRDVRHYAARFGGSHAQRDLIDLTLIEAARRSGASALESALRAERAAARPQAPTAARRLAA